MPHHPLQRREFVQLLMALAPGVAPGGRLFAAPAGSPRFLLVFLRGGYDCANVLIPYSSADYYELRPNIAVPRPAGDVPIADAVAAIALDADWALAPALRNSIGPLYTRGEAAFVPFAGTDDLSRSHFETQDAIELGQTNDGSRDSSSGFLARLSAVVNDSRSIAFTESLPLVLRGDVTIPNVSLKGAGKPVFDERQASILSQMYADHRLYTAVAEGLELRQEVGQAIQLEMQEANRNAITAKGFELEARRMGRFMRDQFRIGFVDVGGWDTHVNEGAAEGVLATNLDSLGRGLAAFAEELGPEWRNTVVVVVSEFGRTFRENGSRGTDHGHGSVYWVLGGGIRGKRIAGEQVRVDRTTLFQDRDYPVLNDYRGLLGDLFRSLWGLSADQLQQVFPQAVPLELQLI